MSGLALRDGIHRHLTALGVDECFSECAALEINDPGQVLSIGVCLLRCVDSPLDMGSTDASRSRVDR